MFNNLRGLQSRNLRGSPRLFKKEFYTQRIT